jgi:hypothetical protein
MVVSTSDTMFNGAGDSADSRRAAATLSVSRPGDARSPEHPVSVASISSVVVRGRDMVNRMLILLDITLAASLVPTSGTVDGE